MQNLFSVEGKAVLITGGSKGLGRMIAEAFVRSGAKVYITARHGAVCAETASELSEFGECIGFENDLSNSEGVNALVEEMNNREDQLDVLVNNAATGWHEPFDSFPEKGWDKTFNLNIKSPFFLIQGLAPLLEKQKSKDNPAKVINIASIDGLGVAFDDSFPYSASKAGMIHLTKSLAKELAPRNIWVNCISPGAFASDMNIMARDNPEILSQAVPTKSVGSIEDIGGSCIYLASRASNYTNGVNLVVDGGFTSVAYGGLNTSEAQ